MHRQTVINCQVAVCKHTLQTPLPPVVRGTAGHQLKPCMHKRPLKQKRQLERSCQRICASSQPDAPASAVTTLSDAPLQQLSEEQAALPAAAGVYAVYDKDQTLQYIGLSRKVSASGLLRHIHCLCQYQLCSSVLFRWLSAYQTTCRTCQTTLTASEWQHCPTQPKKT